MGKNEYQPHDQNSHPIAFFEATNIPGVNAAGTNRINTSGGVAGGQIGYLWQGGKAIFGVEAAFDWTNLRGSRINSQAYFNNPGVYSINENPRADWLFTFLGRVGYDFGSWYPLFDGGRCRFKPQIRLQLHGPDFRTDVRLRGVIQPDQGGFCRRCRCCLEVEQQLVAAR